MGNKKSIIETDIMIHVRDNIYKVRSLYKGKSFNRYYMKYECDNCHKTVYRDLQNSKKSKLGFCNGKCKGQYYSGANNPNWGGVIKNKRGKNLGHILEYSPNHPNNKGGFVPQHRLVVENKIGRILNSKELIHHIDCDMRNNDPENLVITDIYQHNTAHSSLEKCVKELISKKLLWFDELTMTYKVN